MVVGNGFRDVCWLTRDILEKRDLLVNVTSSQLPTNFNFDACAGSQRNHLWMFSFIRKTITFIITLERFGPKRVRCAIFFASLFLNNSSKPKEASRIMAVILNASLSTPRRHDPRPFSESVKLMSLTGLTSPKTDWCTCSKKTLLIWHFAWSSIHSQTYYDSSSNHSSWHVKLQSIIHNFSFRFRPNGTNDIPEPASGLGDQVLLCSKSVKGHVPHTRSYLSWASRLKAKESVPANQAGAQKPCWLSLPPPPVRHGVLRYLKVKGGAKLSWSGSISGTRAMMERM